METTDGCHASEQNDWKAGHPDIWEIMGRWATPKG